jgi:hypothetical protein
MGFPRHFASPGAGYPLSLVLLRLPTGQRCKNHAKCNAVQTTFGPNSPYHTTWSDRAAWEASLLYTRTVQRAWLASIWSRLSGQSRDLLDPGITARLTSRRLGQWCAPQPVHVITIRNIVGTLCLSAPFDCHFLPQAGHSCEQWLRVAQAWIRGLEIPPVELLAAGPAFLVRDGHYRISVARALGQETIDATTWDLPVGHLNPAARQTLALLSRTL